MKILLICLLTFNCIFLLSCFGEQATTEPEKPSEQVTVAVSKATSEATSAAATEPTSALPLQPEKSYDLNEVYDAQSGVLRFDIYYPTKIRYEKSPLLIAFHGGGWVAGDKSQIMDIFAPIVANLREEGFTVATVQYRYAQDAVFPAQIRDCANAIQYIKDNAEKYNIDVNSIGVMGYSAGAQLAMLASYLPVDIGYPLYEREYSFDIKYCVSFAGPSKMYGDELDEYSGNIKYLLDWLFGGPYSEKEAEYMAGSPYFHIDENTKKTPLFLAHDQKDNVVPFSQSQVMYNKVLEANIPCELLVLSGVYHQIDFNSSYMSSPSSEEAAKTVLDFIRKYSEK